MGANGPRGPRGRDAQITCEPSIHKRRGVAIKCVARYVTTQGAVVKARLLRGRTTVATGTYAKGRLSLTTARAVPAGRYTLRLFVRRGRSLVTTDTAIRLR